MKILQTIYEFHNEEYNTTNGLYYVEVDSGRKYYFLRNDESVGVIQHSLGKPATECIYPIWDKVKEQLLKLLGENK